LIALREYVPGFNLARAAARPALATAGRRWRCGGGGRAVFGGGDRAAVGAKGAALEMKLRRAVFCHRLDGATLDLASRGRGRAFASAAGMMERGRGRGCAGAAGALARRGSFPPA
jgi:hypothetical protein